MVTYHGGKQRIGRKIAETIAKNVGSVEGYCEPFCGMLGVYQYIPLHLGSVKYLAGDIHESTIKLWKESQKGWKYSEKKVTEKEFFEMRDSKKSSAEKAVVGNLYGFRSVYFKSYRTDVTYSRMKKTGEKIKKISDKLRNVEFSCGGYEQYSHLKGYVIYCDPPYTKHGNYYLDGNVYLKFDHRKFWEWVRVMSMDNEVFVSEYSAPDDFEDILGLDKEKLFRYKMRKNTKICSK